MKKYKGGKIDGEIERGERLKSQRAKTGAVGSSSRGRRSHLRPRKRFPLSMRYNGVISR